MPTTLRSFCKINLGLAIGPARADGFHALTTCYQTLEAYDRVTVEAAPAGETALRISCTDARVPCGPANTAWKITEHALAALGVSADVDIHIEKRLPVQGGLGAGSANAVGALLALERELARHGIAPLPGPEKLRIAAEVGSDVPLFLIGGAILGLGRGEQVYPLPDLPATECVLALPAIGVSTPQAFRDWDELQSTERRAQSSAGGPPATLSGPAEAEGWTGLGGSDKLGALSRALASALCPGLPAGSPAGESTHSSGVSAMGEDLAGKADHPLLALVRTGIENGFEEVVFRQHPSLGTIRRMLADSANPEEAAVYAALSGSGSALFGLYGTEAAAGAAAARLSASGIRFLRTKTLPRDGYWRSMVEKTQGQERKW